MPPAKQCSKNVGKDRQMRGRRSENRVWLVEAEIHQLLDTSDIYGPIIGQRVKSMDEKHRGREQRDGNRRVPDQLTGPRKKNSGGLTSPNFLRTALAQCCTCEFLTRNTTPLPWGFLPTTEPWVAHTCRAFRHVWDTTVLHRQLPTPNTKHTEDSYPRTCRKARQVWATRAHWRREDKNHRTRFPHALLLIAAQDIIERHNALEGSFAGPILNR
jgi:hypothetical protein